MDELQIQRFRGDRESALELCRRKGNLKSALVAARIEMGAGFNHEAREWLKAADRRANTVDDIADVALNNAMLAALAELDLTFALNVDKLPLRLDPFARLWRAKLQRVAEIYREQPPRPAVSIARELRMIQRDLANAGEIYDAHAVAMDRVDRLSKRWQPVGWRAVESLGIRDGQPATRANALLCQAVLTREVGNDPTSLLKKAEIAYQEANHRDGQLRVSCERTMWSVEHLGAHTADLRMAAESLWDAGARKAAISALMNAGQIASRRGDRSETLIIQGRIQALAKRAGYKTLAREGLLHQAERAMRDGFHSLARDLCDRALSDKMPRVLRANFLTLRGSAHSFVKARDLAIEDRQAAYNIYLEIGADDLAADIVCAFASDLASTRSLKDVVRANALLENWIEWETKRNNILAAYQKRVQLAFNSVLLFLAERNKPDAKKHLDAAKSIILAADKSLDPYPEKHADRVKIVSLKIQTEAQIAAARGEVDASLTAYLKAREAFNQLDMPFEVANCDYLIGCFYLNLVNSIALEQKWQTAQLARNAFEAALGYYDTVAGMRLQAANARQKMAKLNVNLLSLLERSASEALYTEAERLLLHAAAEIDLLRRAYTAPGNLNSYAAKSSFSEPAQEIAEDALRLYLNVCPNARAAWQWTVRSKARAFADLLGIQAVVPPSVRTKAKEDHVLADLIDMEASLTRVLAEAQPENREKASRALNSILTRMATKPELSDYVVRRSGGMIAENELSLLQAETGHDFALVDWVQTGDRLFILVARPGHEPAVEPLPFSAKELESQLGSLFENNRVRMTLRGGAKKLAAFSEIVRPLEWLAKQGETLLFCPTGVINPLPLHALPLAGATVWHRHPVAYTLGLGVLRLTCVSAKPRGVGMSVFGDPTLDRANAAETAKRIAARMGQVATLGQQADFASVTSALQQARVIHYQGHADFQANNPMEAHLLLANRIRLTAREIFDLPDVVASTVTLGACKGAQLGSRAGHEPEGLIAALLVAGVRSVTAAGWPVSERSAGELMEHYYSELLAGSCPIDALRKSALTLADNFKTQNLYHWAPFRLYGNPWFAPFRGGTKYA